MRLLCPWDFSGKNTGAGCPFLLYGIFPSQELNPHLPCLLHCRQVLHLLSHQGSLSQLLTRSSLYFHFIYCILFISLALTASFVFSSEASSLYPSFPDKIPTVFTYLPCILLSILWLMLWILYVVNCVILFHYALFSGVFCWAFIWDQFLSLLILLNFLCLSEFR